MVGSHGLTFAKSKNYTPDFYDIAVKENLRREYHRAPQQRRKAKVAIGSFTVYYAE